MERYDNIRQQLQTAKLSLAGTIPEWAASGLDVDALVAPLGLSGPYTVRGLDRLRDNDGNELEDYYNHKHEFSMTLTPEMTALHLVRSVAREYERVNGDELWHRYFEFLAILEDARLIEFAMGS